MEIESSVPSEVASESNRTTIKPSFMQELDYTRLLSQRTQLRTADTDLGSNYALQVALKNMKERCQKQQKRNELLEEENSRLINNKSELYEEIAKLRETQIKLREKNLQLSQEVHSKHQEACSSKENLSTLSRDHFNITNQNNHHIQENKELKKDIQTLAEENAMLHNRLQSCSNERLAQPMPKVTRSVMTQTVIENNPVEQLKNKALDIRDKYKRHSYPLPLDIQSKLQKPTHLLLPITP